MSFSRVIIWIPWFHRWLWFVFVADFLRASMVNNCALSSFWFMRCHRLNAPTFSFLSSHDRPPDRRRTTSSIPSYAPCWGLARCNSPWSARCVRFQPTAPLGTSVVAVAGPLPHTFQGATLAAVTEEAIHTSVFAELRLCASFGVGNVLQSSRLLWRFYIMMWNSVLILKAGGSATKAIKFLNFQANV